jgi:hypothetical protein
MPRSVFFSFHYQRDIMRVQQIKQHCVAKATDTEAGYFDGSLEEKAKKEGDLAVKNLIDKGLSGSSTLCVLIGKETHTRRWVDYEILKSVELGMGIFGIRIHQLKDPKDGADTAGSKPCSAQMTRPHPPQIPQLKSLNFSSTFAIVPRRSSGGCAQA